MNRFILTAAAVAVLSGCAVPGQFGNTGKPAYFNATVLRVDSNKQKVAPPKATTAVERLSPRAGQGG